MNKTELTKNLAKKQLVITRQFAAPVALVWKTWTDSSLLDQWWAPKPWKARTKSMDFREGGTWLYAMLGPEGEESWARADFEKIISQERITVNDSFCDANGVVNEDIPGMHWVIAFSQVGAATRVQVTATFSTLEDLETIEKMGFQEGFTMAHGNLDELLLTLV